MPEGEFEGYRGHQSCCHKFAGMSGLGGLSHISHIRVLHVELNLDWLVFDQAISGPEQLEALALKIPCKFHHYADRPQSPGCQNSPKALQSMVFGPKSLNI